MGNILKVKYKFGAWLFCKNKPVRFKYFPFPYGTWAENNNKTGTSQVGAISKAQKAQNIFLEKKLEIFEKKNFRKMSHSAKNVKGGPF